jgi:serine/threonine-protein kinase
LLKEARTTGSLEHPGIIPVHALASTAEGAPALVMKRVDGVSWATLLDNPDDPAWPRSSARGDRLEVNLQIFQQVCNAIAFAHRQGVLHRDLKPANVLIGEFGAVYVADWGVATRKDAREQARVAGLLGTPAYMAPEMCTGEARLMDERTDVYLLGATLFHVLTGAPPHPGTTVEEAVLHAVGGPQPTLPASVPEELAALCLRALARSPEDRYPSALELREAVATFLTHRGSLRLEQAASARWAVLEPLLASPAATAEQVAPLLSECRFGFMQALAEWPENPAARAQLARCLEQAAWLELAQGHPSAARALMLELHPAPPRLEEAVRAAEAAARLEAQQRAQVKALELELDPRIAGVPRAVFFTMVIIAVLGAGLLPSLPAWVALEQRVGTYVLLVKLLPVASVFSVGFLVARRQLLGTRINRRVMGGLALSLIFMGVNRLAGARMGLSIDEVTTGDLLIGGTIAACAAVMINWRFGVGAVGHLLGVAACLQWPSHSRTIFALTSGASLTLTVLMWRQWRSELALGQPEDP